MERLIYKWSTEVYCAIVASQFIVILLTVGLTRGKVVELEWCIDWERELCLALSVPVDYYILQYGKLSNFLYIGGDLPKLASFVILLLDGYK